MPLKWSETALNTLLLQLYSVFSHLFLHLVVEIIVTNLRANP